MKEQEILDNVDAGIRREVEILRKGGIETFESCQGGTGHPCPEPIVRFHGEYSEGFKALSVALTYGLRVACLRRTYDIQAGELVGPWWELVFVPTTV